MAHRKYYNMDGMEVPSVTNIVKLLPKPGIDSWANWMGLIRHINLEEYLQQKADYGTYCHELFEQFFMGFMTTGALDHNFVTKLEFYQILDKLQFIKNQFRKLDIEVINMEMGLDGSRYGGTLDMLAYLPAMNRTILFDLKTSKSLYQSHLIQLAGYTGLLKEVMGIDVTDIGVILLSKPIGNDMIRVMTREENRNNEEIFKKLLDIYYLQKKGDNQQ